MATTPQQTLTDLIGAFDAAGTSSWHDEWTDSTFDYPQSARYRAQADRPVRKAAPTATATATMPARPAMRAERPNRYAGTCADCGGPVAAEAGRLGAKVDGRWTTYHLAGTCPAPTPAPVAAEAPAPAAKPARANRFGGKCGNCRRYVEAEAGTLEKIDGAWVVYHAEGACPTAYYNGVPEGRYALDGKPVKFYRVIDGGVYAQASNDLHPLGKAGADAVAEAIHAEGIEAAARRYGQELGKCCRCGRALTSDWRKAGIGPVCIERAGW